MGGTHQHSCLPRTCEHVSVDCPVLLLSFVHPLPQHEGANVEPTENKPPALLPILSLPKKALRSNDWVGLDWAERGGGEPAVISPLSVKRSGNSTPHLAPRPIFRQLRNTIILFHDHVHSPGEVGRGIRNRFS